MSAAGVEALRFMEEWRAEMRKMIRDEVAQLEGAHRAYAWSIADPTVTPAPPPPAPYLIELPCRPVDLVAACLTAPSGSATFDVQRSLDNGATWTSILQTLTTIAIGQRFGAGGTFKWEEPETRTLVAPATEGALPLVLQPGDLIKLVATPASAQSLTVQLRVQRVGEYARRGK